MNKRQKRGCILVLIGLVMVFAAMVIHLTQEKQDTLAGETAQSQCGCTYGCGESDRAGNGGGCTGDHRYAGKRLSGIQHDRVFASAVCRNRTADSEQLEL